jgi:hypothetical protein
MRQTILRLDRHAQCARPLRGCAVLRVLLFLSLKTQRIKHHMTHWTFETIESAVDFSRLFNQWGARRNNGSTIAFRDGKTVTLRPEFDSKESRREFLYLKGSFE